MLKIKYIDSYTKNGCNITGRLGLIEYWDNANSRFNSADRKNGLFDRLDKAKKIAIEHHPGMTVELDIPDLVFRY